MRGKLAMIASGEHDGRFLASLVGLQDEAVRRAGAAQPLSPLDAADREDEVADWLDSHGVAEGWQLAPTFVQAGLDTGWLDRVAEAVNTTGQDWPALV